MNIIVFLPDGRTLNLENTLVVRENAPEHWTLLQGEKTILIPALSVLSLEKSSEENVEI